MFITAFTCPLGTIHGFFPDVANCSTFYECVNGVAYHLPCEEDLFFNPAINVCDFPANVNCPSVPVAGIGLCN